MNHKAKIANATIIIETIINELDLLTVFETFEGVYVTVPVGLVLATGTGAPLQTSV